VRDVRGPLFSEIFEGCPDKFQNLAQKTQRLFSCLSPRIATVVPLPESHNPITLNQLLPTLSRTVIGLAAGRSVTPGAEPEVSGRYSCQILRNKLRLEEGGGIGARWSEMLGFVWPGCDVRR
jgi:hypothetical protein